ncbi:small integral membrane protein 26-like [Megalops cyprinoides]|uniref:small integral membrane protein 26-like n=1 Tax=Megalops cyprinoides TaxID=118141 RepID=UPI0018644D78|nr:small integral membrane protein 26-like [Megalops cyprinoides]
MNLKDVVRWNVRVSLIYAVGIWTLMGTYGYYRLKRPKENEPEDSKDGFVDKELLDEVAAVPEGEKLQGFHVKTTVVYKENFVPYSTRLFNYLKTLSVDAGHTSDSQGPEK